tara:strand:- start:593 stop:904 length:312 start_codon:yes stop_codon:yes gene_type:complete
MAEMESSEAAKENIVLPSELCLSHAAKIAVVEDKPIMLDYWVPSLSGECFIGVKDDSEKLLVKNEDEYTSPISKIFKVNVEYLIMTENSLYVVSANVGSKRIQ